MASAAPSRNPPVAEDGSHDDGGEESCQQQQPEKKRKREKEEEEDEEEEEGEHKKEDEGERAEEVEEEEEEEGGLVDANAILVRNETDIDLYASLHITNPDGSGRGTGVNLPAHSTVDVTRYREWTLSLDRVGFMFRGDVQIKDDETNRGKDPDWGKPRVVLDALGRVFHVIENPDRRPVAMEEVKAASDLIVACLECGGRVPLPFRDTIQDCWVWIATQLGRRPEEAAHVKEGVRSELARGTSRPSWDKLYNKRCATLPAGSPHVDQLKDLMLNQRSVGIVVYFRALDRYPGGNADWAVLKFKTQFDLSSAMASRSASTTQQRGKRGGRGNQQTKSMASWSVNWMVYRNWDGQVSITSQPAERESLPHDKVVAKLLQPLADLIAASEEHSVDTTIIEHARDEEESDTEWSSVEVLVYVPREHAGNMNIKLMTSDSTSSSSSSSTASSTTQTSNTESFLVKAKDTSPLVKEEWPLAFRLHQRAVSVRKKKRPNSRANAAQEAHAKEVVKGASTLFRKSNVRAALEHMRNPTDVQMKKFTDVYVPPIFLPEQ